MLALFLPAQFHDFTHKFLFPVAPHCEKINVLSLACRVSLNLSLSQDIRDVVSGASFPRRGSFPKWTYCPHPAALRDTAHLPCSSVPTARLYAQTRWVEGLLRLGLGQRLVQAMSAEPNFKSFVKVAASVARFGAAGFSTVGDSAADEAVWRR